MLVRADFQHKTEIEDFIPKIWHCEACVSVSAFSGPERRFLERGPSPCVRDDIAPTTYKLCILSIECCVCGYFGPGGALVCEFMHKQLGKRGKIEFQFATSLGFDQSDHLHFRLLDDDDECRRARSPRVALGAESVSSSS